MVTFRRKPKPALSSLNLPTLLIETDAEVTWTVNAAKKSAEP
jgi:hypothetical protein